VPVPNAGSLGILMHLTAVLSIYYLYFSELSRFLTNPKSLQTGGSGRFEFFAVLFALSSGWLNLPRDELRCLNYRHWCLSRMSMLVMPADR
jgi:hypothetical protein